MPSSGPGRIPSLARRATLAASLTAAAFALAMSLPVSAAVSAVVSAPEAPPPPKCPAQGIAEADCVIHWTSGAFSPATTQVRTGVKVQWANDNGGTLTGGAVDISPTSGPAHFETITVDPGDTSIGVRMTGAGQEAIQGEDTFRTASGTITIVAKPASQPTVKPTKKPTQQPTKAPSGKPTQKASDKPKSGDKPDPKASPSPTAIGQGLTQQPPLGLPTTSPGPESEVDAPLLAIPLTPTPTPSATATPVATAPQTLSQPVHARRLGLPGTLAAVLLAGVFVGVVRLARAEYGGPH